MVGMSRSKVGCLPLVKPTLRTAAQASARPSTVPMKWRMSLLSSRYSTSSITKWLRKRLSNFCMQNGHQKTGLVSKCKHAEPVSHQSLIRYIGVLKMFEPTLILSDMSVWQSCLPPISA